MLLVSIKMSFSIDSVIQSNYQAWLVVALISIATLLYIFTGRNLRIKKYVDKLNGPFSIPVLGSGLWFIRPNYGLSTVFKMVNIFAINKSCLFLTTQKFRTCSLVGTKSMARCSVSGWAAKLTYSCAERQKLKKY